VRSAVDAVVKRSQRFDVLVNCAAKITFQAVVSLEEADRDDVIATNLRSVFLLCKYCLPHMEHGAIVNISSVHAHQTTVNLAPYAASKGGVEAFTRALSRECKEHDVRVNSVAPGAVETPMLRSNPLVQSGEEKIQGRIGEPEEIAAPLPSSPQTRQASSTEQPWRSTAAASRSSKRASRDRGGCPACSRYFLQGLCNYR
jgi:glucose 1-dehydrogenase